MMIFVDSAVEAVGYKNQLIAGGLVVDQDFTWAYHPAIEDYMDPTNYWPSRVEFTFADPVIESFYRLKWIK